MRSLLVATCICAAICSRAYAEPNVALAIAAAHEVGPSPSAIALNQFEQVCVLTDDHRAAFAKARSLGFLYAPAALASALGSAEIEGAVILMKGYDGAFLTLIVGTVPNPRPEFVDEFCALGVAPGEEDMDAVVQKFLDVGPPQLQAGKLAAMWYALREGRRVPIDQTKLSGAAIKSGLRPRAVMVAKVVTQFGPTSLISQFGTRPRY
jgi:hypothetical protein